MTIGIDIRILARGTRTGIEEYTINLLSRLLSLDKNIKFKLFYNAFSRQPLDYPWLRLPNVELREFGYPNRFVFDPAAKFLKLPKIDRLLGGIDVLFAPHFLLAPCSRACKKVLTFHDLSFEYFPEFFPWRKRSWHKFLSPRARAGEAEKIIAVSESTKNDLVDLYGAPEEKIKVIYSGVGEEFQVQSENLKFKIVKEKYNLPEKFILYFGTIEPRKNIAGLICAFEIFKKNGGGDYKLVIAGGAGWLCQDIFRAAKNSDCARDIIFTGFVTPSDKTALYNLAALFVYPSFFEGFGFPPLEAMACGAPVITSNTSCFPEVAGEAALMVDPYNFGEIAWAMQEVLRDENLRRDLIGKGLGHAKKFSWDRCAEDTLKLITHNF